MEERLVRLARTHWVSVLATALASSLVLGVWLIGPHPIHGLALGLGLAVALGVLSQRWIESSTRARGLAAANLALEAKVDELDRLASMLEARMAERTDELEGLTRSFSHDLKSPLGAILNFTAILEVDHRDQWDGDTFEILARIRRSATRASELLDDLARFSRVGRAALDVQLLDMGELARDAFSLARAPEQDRNVEFRLEALPAARGDRALLTEALGYLFENALKFSRDREKRWVRVRGNVANGECVYEVSDNGQGFDMQYAGKLFGLFERLHSSPGIAGNGIGLALVKKIVQRHGGRVWADSTVDAGSRFSFTLPRSGAAP
jgi:light-regulated signal transduction histidine kinase (bacteriophytochrome)